LRIPFLTVWGYDTGVLLKLGMIMNFRAGLGIVFAVLFLAPVSFYAFAAPENIDLQAVVKISATRDSSNYTFKGARLPKNGEGSGFAVSANKILTNAHVVWGASVVEVVTYDGKIIPAKIVEFDSDLDIAVLRVDERLPAVTAIRKSSVVQGEAVYAIGHPEGRPDWTVMPGVVKSVYHISNGFEKNGAMIRLILTNAIGERGASGGPLFDSKGRVVGIVARVNRMLDGWLIVVPITKVLESFVL